jgi:ABC-type multidrug transport system fused ATPase/permease subunit
MKNRYKYVIEATVKTRAIFVTIVAIVMSFISLSLNTAILSWISKAITNYQDPMKYINLIVAGCIINTIISTIKPLLNNVGSYKAYTYIYDKFASKLVNSDYDMFTKFSPGEITTVSGNLPQCIRVVPVLLNTITYIIQFTVNLIAIGLIAWKVAIPTGILYIIGGILLYLQFKRWGRIDTILTDTKHKRGKELDEVINGFSEIRSFAHARDYHLANIKELNMKTYKLQVKRVKVDGTISFIWDIIDTIVTVAIVSYCILALTHGSLASATAMALVTYSWRLIDPLVGFINKLDEFSEYSACIPRVNNILNYESSVSKGIVDLESFDNEIKLENVSFSYDKSNAILKNINLTIKKGQHIGICGPSGGGKSTLLKLIPKFYETTDGNITIDNIDINDITDKSLMEHIGIVHQDPFIIDGSIMDNIKYAGLSKSANISVSDLEAIEAAKKASIYDFIMSLPEKFDTQVGPRGLKLSGGQKQRIALARLFVANPDIILLDEATSALDNDTEKFVQDSLNAFKDKTMIVVAHRLSTIKDSDMIVVINNHTIAESGTHEELLHNPNSIYRSMYLGK